MKRPDHRCHGTPVLRDVQPGKVPVAVHHEDGTLEGVYDFRAEMVQGVEIVAKGKRVTAAIFTEVLAPALRHWRNARGIN